MIIDIREIYFNNETIFADGEKVAKILPGAEGFMVRRFEDYVMNIHARAMESDDLHARISSLDEETEDLIEEVRDGHKREGALKDKIKKLETRVAKLGGKIPNLEPGKTP